MTETSPLAAVAWPPADTAPAQYWRSRASQGKPLCGVEIRIVDGMGRALPKGAGSVGEVEIRGPWVTGSYYHDEDTSKFNDGWLRTGDVGTIDDHGYLMLTDRAKDVIKSGGEWISSVELEHHLMEHPGVLEAAVVAVPDERWQERPLAVVVCTDGVTAAELRNHLAARVARWWLPERWTYVEEIPRTSVGKFDKKLIRSQYAEAALRVIECRD